jgi:two-component system response regulator
MESSERTILLVEDNPDEVLLTLRALKKGKILNPVHTARDGVEALDYLHANPLPALVLLDINLPRVGGIEVLQRLRSEDRTRLLPVVILTSSREDRDILAGYQSGANSYIRKPVDFTQFAEAIHQLGLYWLVINQPPPAGA